MSSDEVLFEIKGSVGFITINRPQALNALSHRMVRQLSKHLDHCYSNPEIITVLMEGNGKAFCAGGDVREVYQNLLIKKHSNALAFFIDEYQLDFKIHQFPKPIISLMHGYVMGGGMGLVQGTSFRIISENCSMAMPETAIGFFPDVGASYFLPRSPGSFGYYMGITGLQINNVEALHANFADYQIEQSQFSEFKHLLSQKKWSDHHEDDIRGLINQFAPLTKQAFPHLDHLDTINEHFNQPSVPAIFDSLKKAQKRASTPWIERTLQAMKTRSPLAMSVTREELVRGNRLNLADCFRMELNMLNESFLRSEFIEGVRAVLVDKDQNAKWNPSNIDEVTSADIETFFKAKWATDQHPLYHVELI